MHEKSSQVVVSTLAVPSNFCFPPVECCSGTSPSHAANERPFSELCAAADGGHNCRRRQRSNARNRHQTTAAVMVLRLWELTSGFVNLALQLP